VDGTLIEAWAGQKSFRRKDDGGSGRGGDFHGERINSPSLRGA